MSDNKVLIENIRRKFLKNVEEHSDLYHKNDIELINTNDWWIDRFILVNKTEDSAIKALIKAMQWRNSFGVNDFNDNYFPKEIYKIGQFARFCKDKEERQILWLIGKNMRKSAELGLLIRQYTVYQFEQIDRQTSNEGWSIVVDPTGMGLSNVDLDYNFFVVEVLQNYYPRGLKYILVVDLPWILNATAKLVLAFMNEEFRNRVKFIKHTELTNYLDRDVIPVHLNGSYNKCLTTIPDGVKSLEQLSHLKFTDEQIKKIYSSFKAELNS